MKDRKVWDKRYRSKHRNAIRNKQRKWRAENLDNVRAYQREWARKLREHKKKHPDKPHPVFNISNKVLRGKEHPQYKGDNAGYEAIHYWVKRRLPKPNKCQNCYKKPYDLANISQKYKRDLTDWKWLCRSCHMTEDGRLKNLELGRR